MCAARRALLRRTEPRRNATLGLQPLASVQLPTRATSAGLGREKEMLGQGARPAWNIMGERLLKHYFCKEIRSRKEILGEDVVQKERKHLKAATADKADKQHYPLEGSERLGKPEMRLNCLHSNLLLPGSRAPWSLRRGCGQSSPAGYPHRGTGLGCCRGAPRESGNPSVALALLKLPTYTQRLKETAGPERVQEKQHQQSADPPPQHEP
ncbi:unnamed protein product [Coccothraustes coccothraustes]